MDNPYHGRALFVRHYCLDSKSPQSTMATAECISTKARSALDSLITYAVSVSPSSFSLRLSTTGLGQAGTLCDRALSAPLRSLNSQTHAISYRITHKLYQYAQLIHHHPFCILRWVNIRTDKWLFQLTTHSAALLTYLSLVSLIFASWHIRTTSSLQKKSNYRAFPLTLVCSFFVALL